MIFKDVEDESLDSIGRIKKIFAEGWKSICSIATDKPIEFKVDTKDIEVLDFDYLEDLFDKINAGEDASAEISKLSSSVREYITEAKAGSLSTDDLKIKLTQASIASAAQSKSFTKLKMLIDEYKAGCVNAGMSQDQFIDGVRQGNKSLAEYLKTTDKSKASLIGYIGYTAKAAASSIALEVAVSALNAVFASLVSLAVAAIFKGIAWAFDQMYTSAEEAAEAMKKASDEYDDAQSKIEQVNSELKTTNDRISELLKKDSLSFVEEQELEDLREAVALLEQGKRIAEWDATKKAKEKADKTVKAYRKTYGRYDDVNQDNIDKAFNLYAPLGDYANAAQVGYSGDLNYAIAAYKGFTDLKDKQYEVVKQLLEAPYEAITEADKIAVDRYNSYKESAESIEGFLKDQLSILHGYENSLLDVPEEERGKYQKDLIEIQNVIATVWSSFDPAGWQQMKFDEIFSSEDMKKYKSELLEIASANQSVGLSLDDIDPTKYKDLLDALNKKGLTTLDLIANINSELII